MKRLICVGLSLLCLGGIYAQAQEAFPFVATVTTKTTNVRAGQNANFESLGQLNKGDDIVVVGASYDWRKIKLSSEIKVYVSAGFVKDLGNGTGEVMANRLNIRATASNNASVLGQLKKGELIRIINKKDDWYEIESPDQSFGWILKDFIAFKSSQIPPARLVQVPVQKVDMDKLPEVVKPVELPAEVILAVGVVSDLDEQMVSPDVRHYLESDGKIYALKGYRRILDGFLHQKVRIEGQQQSNIKAQYPVVLVSKITLVL
ncbi:MAG: SH3 domain-containing protein [Candidatus Omnitrophica bacterium]|nr:SH3 domain-containing protein [Candidatus Omnitrophota bacterium]